MSIMKTDNMRVNLVLHADNSAWIIEKIARRLVEHAPAFGANLTIAERPDSAAEVNHWMSYAFANERHKTPTTMFITHIDDPYKAGLVRRELESGVDAGICMSSDTVERLVGLGAPRKKLCHIMLGHDGEIVPRRIVIGITTRVYADGRKREDLLGRLARAMPLEAFEFRIFGAGWDKIVPELQKAGAIVNYDGGSDDYLADYRTIVAAVPGFDYYLYLGLDEGSMGTLDALSAGVGTIVTDQGFHKDLADDLTHRFITFEELLAIFRDLAGKRSRACARAASLGWQRCAGDYVSVWREVSTGRPGNRVSLLGQPALANGSADPRLADERREFALRRFSPRRIRSALSHVPLLKPIRRLFRK